MYSTLFTTTLVFVLAALRVRAEFQVDTISLTQCKPATLKWANADGPYNVILVPSATPCGDALVDLGDHDSNTLDWPAVNIPAGTQVMISILDSQGQEGWSGAITVGPSDDTSCLTSQGNTPAPPPTSSSSSSSKTPSPTPPSPSPSPSRTPAANPDGVNNAGNLSGGPSMLHFSGTALAVTALGALAVLL